MYMTGDLKVHKSDGVTRAAEAISISEGGTLSLWDSIPEDEPSLDIASENTYFRPTSEGSLYHILVSQQDADVIQPDIIVQEDKWERIERDGHYWKRTSPGALRERAKERDDVDEDEIDF